MKKFLALLLALILCFSLCACGGKVDTLNEKVLTNEEWCGILDFTVQGQRIIKFEKDGTGTYIYPESGNLTDEFTWTIADNSVKVVVTSSDPFGGESTTEDIFEYIKNEDNVQLKRTTGSVIFVPKTNFEKETEAYKQKLLDEAVELDWEAAIDLALENEVKFNNEYIGKAYKYTAEVYEITERYCTVANKTYMGLPTNAIDVYMSTEDLGKLSKHSKITVVGILSSYSIGGRLAHAFLIEE